MTQRRCLGCDELTTNRTRCDECEREHRAKYGPAHRAERRRWQQEMDHGVVVICWRCGQPIGPDEDWDLGHRRRLPSHPEHARHNRRSGVRGRWGVF